MQRRGEIEMTERNLPALKGSEKQIAWAEQIRVTKLTAVDRYMEDMRFALDPEADHDLIERDTRAYARLRRASNAAWWIHHHTTSAIVLINLMAEKNDQDERARAQEANS